MRSIQIFVLRLLVDSETPGALHGVIQRVEEEQAHPFQDGPTLMAWLCEAVRMGLKRDLDDATAHLKEERYEH